MEILCFGFVFILTLIIAYIIQKFQGSSGDGSIYRWRSQYLSEPSDPDDITSYETTIDIFKSGRFSAQERKREYIRRGKSPSGVVDGVYNDTYLEDGAIYNDFDRDWDADA